MRELSLLVVLSFVAPMAEAQVVVPNQYMTTEGIGNNAYPFKYTKGAGHYQQAYDAAQFSGPMAISEISFRYLNDDARPAATADFRMTLSHSANAWTSLSTTFASNIGLGAQVVFDGVWNIAAFSGDPATPNPFTQRLTLTTPFSYDPALGDLLIDVEMRQSATPGVAGAFDFSTDTVGASRVFVDSGNPTSSSGASDLNGLITEFSGPADIIPYGTGCAGDGGFIPVLSMTGTPQAGQQVTLALDNGVGATLSALMISLGQTSVPLGGGCTLLVTSTPLVIFIPLGGSGPGGGSYVLPAVIPMSTPPATIFLQAFIGDLASPIGMSVSNGLQVNVS